MSTNLDPRNCPAATLPLVAAIHLGWAVQHHRLNGLPYTCLQSPGDAPPAEVLYPQGQLEDTRVHGHRAADLLNSFRPDEDHEDFRCLWRSVRDPLSGPDGRRLKKRWGAIVAAEVFELVCLPDTPWDATFSVHPEEFAEAILASPEILTRSLLVALQAEGMLRTALPALPEPLRPFDLAVEDFLQHPAVCRLVAGRPGALESAKWSLTRFPELAKSGFAYSLGSPLYCARGSVIADILGIIALGDDQDSKDVKSGVSFLVNLALAHADREAQNG